jgi:hypothetical protein
MTGGQSILEMLDIIAVIALMRGSDFLACSLRRG